MKKKILFIGIALFSAGTEKSFLSFINTFDLDRYDATLLIAKRTGAFSDQLPEKLKVIEMEEFGEHFLQSGKNAVGNIWNTFIKKRPLAIFKVLPYFVGIVLNRNNKDKVSSIATRLWIDLERSYIKGLEEEYDIAVAYWGDRTMFYMIDKVKADKYITWMHFDYAHPKRDDSIYLPYFEKCDYIANVSTVVDEALKTSLPSVADKCTVIENIQCETLIKQLAEEKAEWPDPEYKGKRILSVARIAYQKGLDLAIRSLKILREEGVDARWYILGDGDEETKASLVSMRNEYGLQEELIFMGVSTNPYPYIRECDVFALPSRFEGRPITVEEAKILSKPIIVCDYLSASEQLAGGRYGVISSFDDCVFSEKLKALLDEENQRRYTEELSLHSFSNEREIDKFYRLIGDKE